MSRLSPSCRSFGAAQQYQHLQQHGSATASASPHPPTSASPGAWLLLLLLLLQKRPSACCLHKRPPRRVGLGAVCGRALAAWMLATLCASALD